MFCLRDRCIGIDRALRASQSSFVGIAVDPFSRHHGLDELCQAHVQIESVTVATALTAPDIVFIDLDHRQPGDAPARASGWARPDSNPRLTRRQT